MGQFSWHAQDDGEPIIHWPENWDVKVCNADDECQWWDVSADAYRKLNIGQQVER